MNCVVLVIGRWVERNGRLLQQTSIGHAFLNGDLKEEVYMDILPGFESDSTINKVCKLRNLLYGWKGCKGMWLKRLLDELQIESCEPMNMFCDNQAAITIAKSLVHNDRTKHVEVDQQFIKEKIEEKIVTLSYIPSHMQATDILTKALHHQNFEELCYSS